MSNETDHAAETEALVEDLEAAHNAYERAKDRVADRGEARLERIADSYEELLDLFARYEEKATGDGNFQTFIEFQEEMARFIDHLPDDLPYRAEFEEVDDLMQQRRLTESDFEQARETLSPVADEVVRLEERDATESRYRDLREKAKRRVRELGERIDDLETLERLGDADLDAPVERLQEPVSTYNDDVRSAFRAFKRDASARTVLAFVDTTTAFPLVPFQDPPPDLREYVEQRPPGTESITQLLEYADYSKSKLDHYVDDATALKQQVGTHKTYLRRLDAEPLTIQWPPLPADELRWRLRELIQVTGRFAPADVVAQLRSVRDLIDEVDYERLRRAASAREDLTDEQRQRLSSGAVAAELSAVRQARERLQATLDDLP